MALHHSACRRTPLEASSVKWYRIGTVTRSTMKLGVGTLGRLGITLMEMTAGKKEWDLHSRRQWKSCGLELSEIARRGQNFRAHSLGGGLRWP